VEFNGKVVDALSTYLARGTQNNVYTCPTTPMPKEPHVSKAEVVTSNPNGVHSFGEPLTIQFTVRHAEQLSRGCFSFQIVNQNQQAVIHAWAMYPQFRLGTPDGESSLLCRFPSLRLNIGQFHLRTYLTEPPGGEIYERLDGICPFEVVRTDETILWGWHPEACAYHEQWEWTVATGSKSATSDTARAGSRESVAKMWDDLDRGRNGSK
jgi:lipopolysaccharide transport system ATP-binding protein